MLKAVIFELDGVIIDSESEGYTVIPYIADLIEDLYNNDIKLFIISSSTAKAIEEVMVAFDIKKYFNGYLSEVNVARPKPAPDIFLKAAKSLGVEPDECIVIEASSYGINAACAAGMISIGYVNPNLGYQDLRKATILLEGFDEVDYTFLNQIYQSTYGLITITESERLIIRELTIFDVPDLFQIYQKPQIREFLDDFSGSLEAEVEKHKAYIQNIYHFYGYGLWGIFLKSSNQLIGRCGIENKMFEGKEIYELGYLLDPSYQGQGYAREFVIEVLNYCFTILDITCITAIIDKKNNRSIRLAEEVGMHCSGECIRDKHNCYLYTIVR